MAGQKFMLADRIQVGHPGQKRTGVQLMESTEQAFQHIGGGEGGPGGENKV
jgi:hypothetical protein